MTFFNKTTLNFGLLMLGLLSIVACTKKNTSKSENASPNVLLILTDDQGYGDVAVHGNDSLDTPFQDILATQGIRMDNFYVSPVCAPTRASLLTGRYHYRTGTTWVTRNGEAMRSEERTLAEVLKDNGYATGCFGKWHNGGHFPQNPNGQGFEDFTGFCGGHWNRYFDPDLEVNGKMIRAKGYITDILTDSAITFMERNRDKPFFAYVPYNTPHTPFISPTNLYQKYKSKGLTDRIASTYGMIESIDNNIGRMLKKLEDLKILENTIVIFITDNGPNFNRYNAGMKGRKGWVTDGGTRVPCFIYWKDKLKGGKVLKDLTSHIDILPTLADLLNLQKVETLPLDGKSFAAVLTGESTELPDRQLFTFHINENKFRGSVRNKEYRLVVNKENDYELTSMYEDPGEKQDLKQEQAQIAAQLYQEYLSKYDEVTKELNGWQPIPIGYQEAPVVTLPAHEGFFTGGLKYEASQWGWCNDWFTNWTTTKDTMYWNVKVANPGTYQVKIQYAAEEGHLGSQLIVQSGTNTTSGTLNKAHTPVEIDALEQVQRQVEAIDQTWAVLDAGTIPLNQGVQKIALFAKDIKNNKVGELKSIILEKK